VRDNRIAEIWEKFAGRKGLFSLEHRLFNATCAITIAILLIFIPFNFVIGLNDVGYMFIAGGLLCAYVYYLSRVKMKYQWGATVFTLTFLTVLCGNYLLNDGIDGPTLIGFYLSFQFVMVMKPVRQYWIWAALHITLVIGLFWLQGTYPELIRHNYSGYEVEAVDKTVTFLVVMVFTLFTYSFIRRNYHFEKLSAERRAEAIETQHLQIAAQHLQLERLNQEKNKMFSIISHDLKSPLDSIRSYLMLLSENMIEPEERAEFEQQLLTVTNNTTELLQNLLSWSKSQMDGSVAKNKTLNAYETLYTTLDAQQSIAENKGIALSYSIDDSVEVIADADMLQLVVRNLVSNAIKFTPEGGNIKIKSFVNNGHCEIAIRDSGRGIPAEMQPDIFTLKTSSTYGTNNEKGVGLGLVLCKEFTELQGGRIWFESEEGVGTTFWLSLQMPAYNQLEMFGS
jgi:signal transduction histidine kinase